MLMLSAFAYSQSLDWSYDYSVSESNMTIGMPQSSIDQVTVDGNAMPIGAAIGVFNRIDDTKSMQRCRNGSKTTNAACQSRNKQRLAILR